MIKSKTINFSLILIVTISLLRCNSEKKKTEKTIESKLKNSMDSLGIISYHLKDSDYVIRMRLSGMNSKKVEKAFSIKEDEYSMPIKKDGYQLELNFRINNPYEKELMIPIPNYFSISNSKDKFFSEKPLFSKSCYCDIIGSSEITNLDGKKLYQISDGECGNTRYCLIFKPNETKEFIIKFDQPILESEKELLLFGFDLHWDNPNNLYRTDLGMILDIKNETIKGLKKM